MFSCIILPIFILSTALLALADPVPLEPAPNAVYTANCHVAWTPDQSGKWKTMYIQLMTGDNINMMHLTTVAQVDGTTTGTFDYACPSVTVHSAIYFYQFSSPNSPTHTWTGRFAIADATGVIVPPPNANQPNGDAIPWGTGALTDPTKAVAAPPYLTGGSVSSNASTSTSSISTSAMSSTMTRVATTSSSKMSFVFATPSSSSSDSSAAASSTSDPLPTPSALSSSSSNSGNTLVLGAVSARALQAGVALAVIAGTFTFMV